MENVFEPMANFGGDVFEPTANFGGIKSKLEKRKNGLEKLKNILKSNKLSDTQKQKVALAVSTGGVFAGLYLVSRLLGNNKKSRFEGNDNFDGEVFEPMNFDGEVFEPMNFDGDYSNFGFFKKKTPEQLAKDKADSDAKAKERAEIKANKKPTDWSKVGTNFGNIVKVATDTITTLAPVMQKPEFQKNLEATCGKSGVILGIGKPRPSYLTCAKNFMEKQGVSNTQFDEWKNTLNTDDANTSNSPSTTGMSLGAKIGITAGILAVVGVAVFFIVKGGKKGK